VEAEGKMSKFKIQMTNDQCEMPNVKVQMPNDNELVGCISLIGFIG